MHNVCPCDFGVLVHQGGGGRGFGDWVCELPGGGAKLSYITLACLMLTLCYKYLGVYWCWCVCSSGRWRARPRWAGGRTAWRRCSAGFWRQRNISSPSTTWDTGNKPKLFKVELFMRTFYLSPTVDGILWPGKILLTLKTLILEPILKSSWIK